MQENLTAIRVVKSYVRGDYEIQKFEEVNYNLQFTAEKAFRLAVLNMPAMQLVMYSTILCILWFGGRLVTIGGVKVGELTGFLSYVMQVLNSLMMFSNVFLMTTRALASWKRISQVMDEEIDIREDASSTLEVKHGDICIAFTPDEEVGNGVEYFDVPGFGADFAYTVDGGSVGEIEYENFNAANLRVEVQGYGIHPGSAKGKMKNAIRMAMEFEQMLTVFDNPEYTDGYEGFHHLGGIEGDSDHTTMHYIVRDHDAGKLDQKLAEIDKASEYLNFKYGEGSFKVVRTGSYQNMKEMILPHMHLVEYAKEAMRELGLNAKSVPIRGGTDGARLSFMGLPCPNLCTGGANYHGRFEYACIEQMELCVEILKKIVEKYAVKEI